jgi:hypothetical protein
MAIGGHSAYSRSRLVIVGLVIVGLVIVGLVIVAAFRP